MNLPTAFIILGMFASALMGAFYTAVMYGEDEVIFNNYYNNTSCEYTAKDVEIAILKTQLETLKYIKELEKDLVLCLTSELELNKSISFCS